MAGELADLVLEVAASGALFPQSGEAQQAGQAQTMRRDAAAGAAEAQQPPAAAAAAAAGMETASAGAGALLRVLKRCAAADGPAAAAVASSVASRLEKLSGDPQARALARAALDLLESLEEAEGGPGESDRANSEPADKGPGSMTQAQQPKGKRKGKGKGKAAAGAAAAAAAAAAATGAAASAAGPRAQRVPWALAERWVPCPIGDAPPGAFSRANAHAESACCALSAACLGLVSFSGQQGYLAMLCNVMYPCIVRSHLLPHHTHRSNIAPSQPLPPSL